MRSVSGWAVIGLLSLSVGLVAAPAAAQTAMTFAKLRRHTTDFDGMLKRRVVRILVPYSKTYFFIDRGDMRGIDAELGLEFERWLNRKYKQGKAYRLHVAFIPTPRDKLFERLRDGLGDIAAGGLTVTPERRALVDFAAPWASTVKEVFVTGPSASRIDSLDALRGQIVMVRRSSSYYPHLVRLNKDKLDDLLRIVAAEENLEDEDILEMVSGGLLPLAVVDRHKARLWAAIYPNLTVRDDLLVNDGGEMAWAIRTNSPRLKAVLAEFVATHKLGTAFGSDIFVRYVKDGMTVKNALAAQEAAKFHDTLSLFAARGAQYRIDALLLAAQGYQESRLDQSMRNRSGAVGIMQIKPSTAREKDIGIEDVDKSADANIHAGAKYLRYLATRYINDPAVDDRNKVLMALAAYNAGPGSLKKFRAYAAKHGLNPNIWFGNVESAAAAIKGFETVQYVSNIYKYFIAYSVLTGRHGASPIGEARK